MSYQTEVHKLYQLLNGTLNLCPPLKKSLLKRTNSLVNKYKRSYQATFFQHDVNLYSDYKMQEALNSTPDKQNRLPEIILLTAENLFYKYYITNV